MTTWSGGSWLQVVQCANQWCALTFDMHYWLGRHAWTLNPNLTLYLISLVLYVTLVVDKQGSHIKKFAAKMDIQANEVWITPSYFTCIFFFEFLAKVHCHSTLKNPWMKLETWTTFQLWHTTSKQWAKGLHLSLDIKLTRAWTIDIPKAKDELHSVCSFYIYVGVLCVHCKSWLVVLT